MDMVNYSGTFGTMVCSLHLKNIGTVGCRTAINVVPPKGQASAIFNISRLHSEASFDFASMLSRDLSPDSSWGENEASRQIIACRKESSATNCQGIGRCFIASAIKSYQISWTPQGNILVQHCRAVPCSTPLPNYRVTSHRSLRRVSDPIIIYPVPNKSPILRG